MSSEARASAEVEALPPSVSGARAGAEAESLAPAPSGARASAGVEPSFRRFQRTRACGSGLGGLFLCAMYLSP